jgi:AcrR family transcriptional regulator
MASLARRGLQATSFSTVLAATGAPRGSLYHHFPDGKDQLVAAAVDHAGELLNNAMETVAEADAEAVVQRFLSIWRMVLERSHCEAGCAVLAVAVATDSSSLLSHATSVFIGWREKLADLLHRGGLTSEAARTFAMMLIASAEGAVVLSRAEQSVTPFDAVARHLIEYVRAMPRSKVADGGGFSD